ncbi:S8 family serine peptidase [Spirillospora sp. NPDC048911]|uniref:S8 family peptidase n=1 Tax=Spirillospora sp. NPDC048911 TaxID=3364527 RepID=UPI00371E969D
MLTRRIVGSLVATTAAAGMTVVPAPPMTGPAQANSYAGARANPYVQPHAGPRGWEVDLVRDFAEAHRVTRGKGATIALLSSGVARDVSALSGALEKEKDLVGLPEAKRLNGTLIASLIVGTGRGDDSLFGIRGYAPRVKLLPVRIYPDTEDPGEDAWRPENGGWDGIMATGIRYAVDRGADVIAVDEYVAARGDRTEAAVSYAHQKGVVVVAAGGDQTVEQPGHPQGLPGVISMGTFIGDMRRDRKWTKANTGILVSAPGVKHPTTGPGGRPWTMWGTRPALAWGASTAALVKAEYPELTSAQVVHAIAVSARHPKGKGRYDTDLGFGVVNPAGALKEAGRISKRPLKVTGESAVADGSHFGGNRAGKVKAVPYDWTWLGGFGGLVLVGLILIGVAIRVLLRPESRDATRA